MKLSRIYRRKCFQGGVYIYIEIHYSMFSFSMIILEKPLNDEIVWACQGYHDVGQGRLLQFR